MKSILAIAGKAMVWATALLLQGCAIGIARYAGPDISPKPETTALQSMPIYFDYKVCPTTSESQKYIWKELNGFSPYAFLSSEYGLTVKEGEPNLGEQAVYVQFIQGKSEESVLGDVSGVIHFISFALIPGFWTEKYNYNIQVNFTKPDGSPALHNFGSHFSKQEYLWFPFILSPDIFASLNGGIDKSNNPEKMVQAEKAVAAEIVSEIQKQLSSSGGVGGWQHESITSALVCK